MTQEPDPNPGLVTDEESFLAFVRELVADRRLATELNAGPHDAPRAWQNDSAEDFLSAALSWADDTQFGRTQGLVDTVSPWRRVAVFLYTGKIYE